MFAENAREYMTDFGVPCTLGAAAFTGIFDGASQRVLDGNLIDAGPQLTAASADVSTAVYGSAITVNAIAYTVAVAEPDGTGMTVLQLRRV
jgi:hypothetical protein